MFFSKNRCRHFKFVVTMRSLLPNFRVFLTLFWRGDWLYGQRRTWGKSKSYELAYMIEIGLRIITMTSLYRWRHHLLFKIKAFILYVIALEALIVSEWLTPRWKMLDSSLWISMNGGLFYQIFLSWRQHNIPSNFSNCKKNSLFDN